MAQYGGFTSGTFPAWALNLLQNVFGTSGIARGLQVTAPGGMQVSVSVDPTALDGVCFLPNGAFFRIDAAVTLNVPSNSSGGTRTDAIVAFVDPTGQSSPAQSLTYQTNWAGGFSGTDNQFVVALVSVGSGVSSVTSGNISMNAATAKLGNAGGASNSMVDPDGVGVKVSDNSSTGNLTLVTTGLTTGVGRNVVLAATDKSGNNHYFYFNTDGTATFPSGTITGQRGAQVSIGNPSYGDITLTPGAGNWVYIAGNSGSSHFDNYGTFAGPVSFLYVPSTSTTVTIPNNAALVLSGANGSHRFDSYANFDGGAAYVLVGGYGGPLQRIFTGTVAPSNATNGDIWIQA